jgi:hypothetical protein
MYASVRTSKRTDHAAPGASTRSKPPLRPSDSSALRQSPCFPLSFQRRGSAHTDRLSSDSGCCHAARPGGPSICLQVLHNLRTHLGRRRVCVGHHFHQGRRRREHRRWALCLGDRRRARHRPHCRRSPVWLPGVKCVLGSVCLSVHPSIRPITQKAPVIAKAA